MTINILDAAESVTAKAKVDYNSFYVGEPIRFQIMVSSTNANINPEVSKLSDFDIQFKGAQKNKYDSYSNINGRISNNSFDGMVYTYILVAKQPGQQGIPSIPVEIDGQIVQTQPVSVSVLKPVETENYKLRLSFSKTNCFVGEPLVMELTFYFDRTAHHEHFMLGSIHTNLFQISDVYEKQAPGNIVDTTVDDKSAKAIMGQANLNGRNFQTIRLRKAIIPLQAGHWTFEPVTVSFETDANQSSGAQKFPNMANMMRMKPGQTNRFNYSYQTFGTAGPIGMRSNRKTVVPSNTALLDVKSLPEKGRPKDFKGYVGKYDIQVSCKPTEINEGEPVTLSVTLSGTPSLDHVQLADLFSSSVFSNQFKISSNMALTKRSEYQKVITQTIRPLSYEVKEIPPLSLSIFDPITEMYRDIKSKPVQLVVKKVKRITAADAEGKSISSVTDPTTNSENIGNTLVSMSKHIQGMPWKVVLKYCQWFFVLLLACSVALCIRKRAIQYYENTSAMRVSSRAFTVLEKGLNTIAQGNYQNPPEEIFKAIRQYLGEKLQLYSGSLTFGDVKIPLESKGVSFEVLQELQMLFRDCAVCQYAGVSLSEDSNLLINRCIGIANQIEQCFNSSK